jgi:hypothetical protein
MSDPPVRPGAIAAAAMVIGGVLIAALPQHAVSIIRLVIVTGAAGAALYVLVQRAPTAWWTSPLDRRRTGPRFANDEVDAIRTSFDGRRQPMAHGPPLPPETLRLLQPLIRGALEGLAATEGAETSTRRLSPATLAALQAEPLSHPPWRSTVQPDARATAAAVHRILDDIEALSAAFTTDQPSETRTPRET